MQILIYNGLNSKVIKGLDKLIGYLENDDFQSADVKKVGGNLYSSRLNRTDRVLFSIYCHQDQSYALILEYIKNHAYEKSRFLNQLVRLDENKIPTIKSLEEVKNESLVYVNSKHKSFNLLDKIVSFDESQQSIYNLSPPLVVIGSAGSGKTTLILEKMKQAVGDVLYVTQSEYLVKNSRNLYYAHHYENEDQQVDFLSFQEFLESIQVPAGKPVTFKLFRQWFSRYRQGNQLNDAHKLFEEFRGVITGPATDKSWLSRQDYLALGIKESIFLQADREDVYSLFEKYLGFLQDNQFYDSNIVSHQYLEGIQSRYDLVVVDEVQDLTNIQLYLIIKSLHQSHDFILCGDSNQIVHPNFFSWSKVKSLFYKQDELNQSDQLVRILNTNYRNSPQVTEIANKILKIKTSRFGSIDKESHYLVESNGHNQGEVIFLQDNDHIRQELDKKTKASTLFAVIVMTDEQKPSAQKHFSTPLVFTIQEAKGLEYENIILYNFLSEEELRYREISKSVTIEDLEEDLQFSRAKDKTDKSLEIYKFYVNSLYVALTRAIKNLYWIESRPKQHLLNLIGLTQAQSTLEMVAVNSSQDDWRQEAHKLELQGKQEQAAQIRKDILKQKTPGWQVIRGDRLEILKRKALDENNKKAKLELFEYGLVYGNRNILNALVKIDFKPALKQDKGLQPLLQKHYAVYNLKKPGAVLKLINQYGSDFRNQFNQTPLMAAAWTGSIEVINALIEQGADTTKIDGNGFTAFQIALSQADISENYATNKLAFIYDKLAPASMSIQVDGHLMKLDKQHMEFFMLNMMIALFYRELPKRIINIGGAFSTQDLLSATKHIPESVLVGHRKKRAYLSSILSKNEVNKEDKNNRKLFIRIKRGSYLFNPQLSIKIEDNWINIYDLLSIDKLAHIQMPEQSWCPFDLNERIVGVLEHNKTILKEQLQANGKVGNTDHPFHFDDQGMKSFEW